MNRSCARPPQRLGTLIAGCILASSAGAQTTAETAPAPASETDLAYIGESARLAIGYDSELDLYGEYQQVFAEQEDSAWVGTVWAADQSGGVQLNYHWLGGGRIDDPEEQLWVNKLFLAWDRNNDNDQKVTLGYGYERSRWFWEAYLSAGVTGRRLVEERTSSISDSVQFTDDSGQLFIQPRTITTLTDVYERPYDWGVGVRVGHLYEEQLLRVRAGLDYEWGDYGSHQTTVSLSAEKLFHNSPHSLALHALYYDKSGDFEAGDSDDAQVRLLYRYDFGGPGYRPRRVPAQPVAVAAPAPMVENRITLETDALFQFDRSDLIPAARRALDQIIERIRSAEVEGPISVIGHTCDIGSDAYNQGLSERRANAVADYLVQGGIARSRLMVEGRGEREPKVPNLSEAHRRQNRRVDITVVTRQPVAAPVQAPGVEWVSKPVWIQRALRNPAEHKRAVDVYRIEQTRSETTLGEPSLVNRPPRAAGDSASVLRDSLGNPLDVLANDSDPDGDALTIVDVSQPANGQVSNLGTSLTYTPAPGFTGSDTFSYTVSDGKGGSASASVVVTVSGDGGGGDGGAGGNRAPQANDDSAVTSRNRPVTIPVLGNDSDPDGDALTIVALTSPANGSVSESGGLVTYAPLAGFRGVDTFIYTVSDGRGGTDSATVTVTVRSY